MAAEVATRLTALKTIYLDMLENAALYGPDYSLDGESVSFASWRKGLLEEIEKINELIQQEDPYEIVTYSI